MPTTRVISTSYRALFDNGDLWCQTTTPGDCARLSAGMPVRFEQKTIIQTEGDWEPWQPEDTDG